MLSAICSVFQTEVANLIYSGPRSESIPLFESLAKEHPDEANFSYQLGQALRQKGALSAALEAFDTRLPELLRRLRGDDLLVITADHGCDPTWSGTDHTREQVPLLVLGGDTSRAIGARSSFADVGASVALHLELPARLKGRPF